MLYTYKITINQRIAIFPVKTLQSIEVTSTPAAPTCVLGKTAEITLKVVANYLTGTVASTEEVTTYTTGTNYDKATKVFTPASTAAGTENIVVTFETKTANVAVTISAEAPKPTTVTVTAIAIKENASATAEVVVKDQFGTVMTTGYTLTYASSNEGVATVATTGVVTAAAYNSTATTATLTVTATATTGTATGTATITVSADPVNPTLVKAEALNSTTLLVYFSKKLDSTSALTKGNYSLLAQGGQLYAIGTTKLSDGLTTAIDGSAIFYDSTNTIVRLTIAANASTANYAAGGFTNGTKYWVYVSNVKDIATTANTIQSNSNVEFTGTSTPDASKPTISSATYNKGTGRVDITFSKILSNTSIDYTKVKFNGVALTGSIANYGGGASSSNAMNFDVAAADKTAIAAYTTEITITLAAGAVSDVSSPAITNDEASVKPTVTVPPALVNATYTESTDTLTLGFDQILNLSASYINVNSKFQVKLNDTTTFYLTSSDIIQTTANAQTVEVKLASSNINTIESGTFTTPKIVVNADAIKNMNNTFNVKQDDTTGYPAIALTIVKDTTKPTVQSIGYDETTKKMTIGFNVTVQPTLANQAQILVKTTNADAQIAAFTTNVNMITVSGNNMIIDMGATSDAANQAIATALKTNQQGASTSATFTPYLSYLTFPAGTFTKAGSILTNEAVTVKATATTVTYTDNAAPTYELKNSLTNAAPEDQVTIPLLFSEKLDKTSAETAANYTIWNNTTNSALPVNYVYMTDAPDASNNYGMVKVTVITGVQTSGNSYTIKVNGVKDASSNAIANLEKTFSGSATSAPNPYPVSATIKDDGNNQLDANDYVAVTFDRPIKLNTGAAATEVIGGNNAANQNNFALTAIATEAFAANYSKTNLSIDATNDKVALIKVDSTLSSGVTKLLVGQTKINFVTGGNLILDKYSNVAAKAAGAAVLVSSPGGVPAISKVEIEDVNANAQVDKGDKLHVTLNKAVYKVASDDLAATDFVVYKTPAGWTQVTNPFGTLNVATPTTSIATNTTGTTVTIVIGEGTVGINPQLMGAGLYLGFGTADQIKDSWAVQNVAFGTTNSDLTTGKVKITPKTTVTTGPKITDVRYVAVGAGVGTDDMFYVTFDQPVYFNSAAANAAANLVGGATATTTNWKLTSTSNLMTVAYYDANDPKTIKFTVDGDDSSVVGTYFDLKAAGTAQAAYALVNFNGDKAIENGTGVQVKYPADLAAPVVTSATFDSNYEVKLVFDKAVTFGTKAPTTVTVDTGLGTITPVNNVANMVLDTRDASNKTVKILFPAGSFNGFVSDGVAADQTNGYGLSIAASSGIFGLANGREVVAVGKSLTPKTCIAIGKDTSVPKVDKMEYKDIDGNGVVDRLDVTLSEPVPSFNATNADLTAVFGDLLGSGTALGAVTFSAPNVAQVAISSAKANTTSTATAAMTVSYTQASGREVADYAGNKLASFSATTVTDKAAPVMAAVVSSQKAMTITFSEKVYSTANASGALATTHIRFSAAGDLSDTADVAGITHTAGTATATATTTLAITPATSTFGAAATSVYDAAGNAVGVIANGTATEFATAAPTQSLAVTAAVGKVVRVVKVGTSTVQYVKADGSGFQALPAELTVANPYVTGLTTSDKYTVQVLTPVAATGNALTLAAGDRTGAVVRVTKVADGVVTYAGATTGIAMVANATVITGNTDPFVVGTGLTATDKYIVEIIAATDVKTANGAGLITLNAGAQTGNVIRIIKAGTATVEYSAAADAAAVTSNAAILTSVANPHTMTGTAAGVYATEVIAAANVLTVN